MAKFKVGDKVKVVWSCCGSDDEALGVTGTIIDISDRGEMVNLVRFDEIVGDYDGPDWFRDDELELAPDTTVAPVVDETVIASGLVTIDYTVASAVVLVGDVHVASRLRELAKNGEEIEVVVRVKRKEA
jgi:hypothetical protein